MWQLNIIELNRNYVASCEHKRMTIIVQKSSCSRPDQKPNKIDCPDNGSDYNGTEDHDNKYNARELKRNRMAICTTVSWKSCFVAERIHYTVFSYIW